MHVESNPVKRLAKVEQFVRATAFESLLYGLFGEAHPFMLFGVDDGNEGDAVDMTDLYNGLSGSLLGELWPDDKDLDCDEHRAAIERADLLTANLFLFALSHTDSMRLEVERYLAKTLERRAPQLAAARAA